jgi:PAS domain S-box-containing protein
MSEAADQNLHRLVLESLPIGVYVVNREGKIILWSAGAERITGHLRQDVLGRLCEDEFLEHTDSENNALIGSRVPLVETLREGRAKSGQFLPVQLQTVPLRDDHGSVQGAVEVFEEMPLAASRERRQSKLAGQRARMARLSREIGPKLALFSPLQEIAGICAKAPIVNTLDFIPCPKLSFRQGHLNH